MRLMYQFGDLTLDVAGDIILDADGDDFIFAAAGTNIGKITNSSSDFLIRSLVQDKDIIFKGADGGSTITALTLDMSDAGSATFNAGATFGSGIDVTGTALAHEIEIGDGSAGGTSEILFSDNVSARGKILYDHSSNPETMLLQTTGTTAISIDNSQNVSISNGNLDVTGSVTADGLTVDGPASFDTNDAANPVVISRFGSTNESLSISINDSMTSFVSEQDEADTTRYGWF